MERGEREKERAEEEHSTDKILICSNPNVYFVRTSSNFLLAEIGNGC